MFHCTTLRLHRFVATSKLFAVKRWLQHASSSSYCLTTQSTQASKTSIFAVVMARDSPSQYPRQYLSSSWRALSSPSFTKPSARRKRQFIPRKAAVEMTEKARTFFKALLKGNPKKHGIVLNYQQASSGQPRMVFSFGFVTEDQISQEDEGVSLEILEDGTPKPPKDSIGDGLPKLYIHHNAFLKVLGAKLDVDTETVTPILYDREGNTMDPNA